MAIYGWKGNDKNNGLQVLEEQLLQGWGEKQFCLIRSNTIKDTLQAMGLASDNICISHPRAVMKQNCSIGTDEDENLEFNNPESRMVCLFRHIRNALAHGNIYVFDNGMLLLKDMERSKCTACILLAINLLWSWIPIVRKEISLNNEENV